MSVSSVAKKKSDREKVQQPAGPVKPRLNVDLPEDEYNQLLNWSDEDDVTLRSLVRQMIKHTEFIRSVLKDPNAKLLVEKDGKFERIIFR